MTTFLFLQFGFCWMQRTEYGVVYQGWAVEHHVTMSEAFHSPLELVPWEQKKHYPIP